MFTGPGPSGTRTHVRTYVRTYDDRVAVTFVVVLLRLQLAQGGETQKHSDHSHESWGNDNVLFHIGPSTGLRCDLMREQGQLLPGCTWSVDEMRNGNLGYSSLRHVGGRN